VRLRLAALAAVLSLLAAPAGAAAACPKTSLGDVEDEVMCLVCGTPLALATEAPQANRERALIQRLVDDCRSKDEIKDRLVAEYGQRVLALPPEHGFDLASYLVPALAVILAGGAVSVAALQWRRARGGGTGPAVGGPSPKSADRLQADLDRYDL
jgi:cytochrome c-type biogenesis protein CcmH